MLHIFNSGKMTFFQILICGIFGTLCWFVGFLHLIFVMYGENGAKSWNECFSLEKSLNSIGKY
jgi:hypothetical protein